jgi:hypothetical protein
MSVSSINYEINEDKFILSIIVSKIIGNDNISALSTDEIG